MARSKFENSLHPVFIIMALHYDSTRRSAPWVTLGEFLRDVLVNRYGYDVSDFPSSPKHPWPEGLLEDAERHEKEVMQDV